MIIRFQKFKKKIDIDEKVEILAKCKCFVTTKDHQEDFRTNPKFRLLNPTKSELGVISQHILQQINTEVKSKLNFNQWQNSSDVISWFKNIKNINLLTFTVFDLQVFYPSIMEQLLKDSILLTQ